MSIKAVVFDAYGTLYDVHSVIAACNDAWPGHGEAVSRLWRAKQLEYTWLRSLMDRYAPFEQVTAEALRYAVRALGLNLTEATHDRLMARYQHLDPYPEAIAALEALKGRTRAIFSNGNPPFLEPLVRNSGLDRHLEAVLSTDTARIFKPSPRSYAVVTSALGLAREEILFVSANPFDVAGSKAYGFQVAWINRNGLTFDELGVRPDREVRQLTDLVPLVQG